MTALALLLIGYSVFSALTLALTQVQRQPYPVPVLSRAAGRVLLAALALLQVAHFGWLLGGQPWHETAGYRSVLFLVAPAFFLFSRPILQPLADVHARWQVGLHLVPAFIGWALPLTVAMPLAFAIGAGYLAWLARSLYALRTERAGYRLELLLLGTVFAVALGVSVLGVAAEFLSDRLFISLYASAIGLAFFLVQVTLGLRPQLSTDVRESAQAAYTHTTLGRIDCDDALARLASLMQQDRLYTDPELGLSALAERLGLTPHQLSELVNTRLGKGFSRYLRECRVEAAKAMLLAEPKASVLSVGLNVGFTSQSNFYEAFREVEGGTPGQYRKLRLASRESP